MTKSHSEEADLIVDEIAQLGVSFSDEQWDAAVEIIASALRSAREAENEACAKVASDEACTSICARDIAKAIRARLP